MNDLKIRPAMNEPERKNHPGYCHIKVKNGIPKEEPCTWAEMLEQAVSLRGIVEKSDKMRGKVRG